MPPRMLTIPIYQIGDKLAVLYAWFSAVDKLLSMSHEVPNQLDEGIMINHFVLFFIKIVIYSV